jgi:hypothetical protein
VTTPWIKIAALLVLGGCSSTTEDVRDQDEACALEAESCETRSCCTGICMEFGDDPPTCVSKCDGIDDCDSGCCVMLAPERGGCAPLSECARGVGEPCTLDDQCLPGFCTGSVEAPGFCSLSCSTTEATCEGRGAEGHTLGGLPLICTESPSGGGFCSVSCNDDSDCERYGASFECAAARDAAGAPASVCM